MPTYEYRCLHGHEFELFQRISDDPVAGCPECGEKAERVITGGAGFLFKGEGFYITDYRSDEYKKKAARETPSSDGDGGGSGGSGATSKKSDSGSGSGGGSSSDGAPSTSD